MFEVMPIKFAVKIVRLKVYIIFCQYDDLDLRQKVDNVVVVVIAISRTLSYGIQTWHDGRLMYGIHAHARFDDVDLDFENV